MSIDAHGKPRLDLTWISSGTRPGDSIHSAVPPIFENYATIVVARDAEVRQAQHRAIGAVLESTKEAALWIGVIETGDPDDYLADAVRATLYANWPYHMKYISASTLLDHRNAHSERGPLPDLVFPPDRSWLATRLWDDSWISFGGSAAVTDALMLATGTAARRVPPGGLITPPGEALL